MQECHWFAEGIKLFAGSKFEGHDSSLPNVYQDPVSGRVDDGRVVTELFPPGLRSFMVVFVAEAISFGIGHCLLMSGVLRTVAAIPCDQ